MSWTIYIINGPVNTIEVDERQGRAAQDEVLANGRAIEIEVPRHNGQGVVQYTIPLANIAYIRHEIDVQ